MLLEYSVQKPLNREPPAPELVSTFLTPSKTAYDRNHGPLPHVDGSKHFLRVDGAVKTPLDISMESLEKDYEHHEVVAALQCAGNRRHTMRTELKEVNGINWHSGAVMNGLWGGVLLADVLEKAGLEITEGHVAIACYQTDVQDDKYYGGSIPLSRAMDKDAMVLLCTTLNGEPLDVNHGAPLRIVIPGIAGARWVKWLDRLTVQAEESSSYYQQRDYKILPPSVDTTEKAEKSWHTVPSINGLPINSIVAYPESGRDCERERDGTLEVTGYALPGFDDGPVIQVEVSIDRLTWREAELTCEPTKWSWATWRYRMPKLLVDELVRKGKDARIFCRARDCRNLQPEKCEWNYRGVAYNAYGESKGFTIVGTKLEREVEALDLNA